ncbi:aspartate kinase [Aliikangiella sp. IMCC44359]|uniref:aspartate kinase n=1 Tax=Aliikangiella sp. IMCC44359 TaxID=3459125 RepID=UPI00403B00FA
MANLITNEQPERLTSGCSVIDVHKFGGSSLASKQRLLGVVNIIEQYTSIEDIIVVSANGDMTDWLVEFLNGNDTALGNISEFYCNLVTQLINNPTDLVNGFTVALSELKVKNLIQDEVLAFGEFWSAKLLVELLEQSGVPALFIDSRDVLKAHSIDSHQCFDADYYRRGFRKSTYGNFGKRVVLTGYVASDENEQTITLGRNGSDYSASLIAYFSNAKTVTLWTDVCGIYTADPRLIEHAYPIEMLSYQEAKSLASIGTNVLHQKTINPLIEKKIGLRVKSSIEPEQNGTCIGDFYAGEAVKSVAIKQQQVSLYIGLENTLEHNKESILKYLFEQHISYVDVNCSSNDIFILIPKDELEKAKKTLIQQSVKFKTNTEVCSVISIVGEQLISNKALLGQLNQYLKNEETGAELITSQFNQTASVIVRNNNVHQLLNSIYAICFEIANEQSSNINNEINFNHLAIGAN